MIIQFRTANDGLETEMSLLTALECDPEEDKTVQSDGVDADINVLVKRFGLTVDSVPDPSVWQNIGDFSDLTDLHTMQHRVLEAKWAFMELPSHVRERFENEPANLLDFLDDPGNAHEAAELGLLTPEAKAALLRPKPVKEPVSDPAPVPTGNETAPEPPK